MSRIELKWAVAGARGRWLAEEEDGDIDRDYVDAVTPTEEEVDELAFRVNAERQRRRVLQNFQMY